MTEADVIALLHKTGCRCSYCWGAMGPEDFQVVDAFAKYLGPEEGTVDHVVARANGGDDSWDNKLPAHRGCNSAKGTKSAVRVRLDKGLPPWGPQSATTRAVLTAGSAVAVGTAVAYATAETDAEGQEKPNVTVGVLTALATGLLVLAVT